MRVSSSSRAILPLVAALLGTMLSACSPSGPAIQEVSPAKGESNVAGDAPIRVVFNRDMDHASVESRLKIKPVIEGCDSTTCPTSWSGRAMTVKHPQHQFATGIRYEVTIAAGYRDSTGQAAGLDHFWDFTTESAPSVGSVTPADRSTGVAVDADITVQLSRSVMLPPPPELTLTASDDPEPVIYRIAIAPDDTRRLVLSPLAPLRPHTAYTLHIGAGVVDSHHNPIGTARDVRFTTGALDLTRTIAFMVRDDTGTTSSRIAELRPPAGVNAPAPSLRVLYRGDHPIQSFSWSFDSTAIYAVDDTGLMTVAPLDGSPARGTGVVATVVAANPMRDEVAYGGRQGALHILQHSATAAPTDLPLPQAGQVSGFLSWSGDGRRLAFAAADGHGGYRLRVLDRETLSVSEVAGVSLEAEPKVMAWSFDGAALAFVRPGAGGHEAWTYRPLAAGDGLLRLGAIETGSLSWSSDGGSVFAAGVAPGSEQPLLERALSQPVDGQTAGFSVIRGSQPGDSQPAAPSFDRRLAFVRQAAGRPQLWIMNNDGTGVAQLTFATYDQDERLPAYGVDAPRWSPGGAGGG